MERTSQGAVARRIEAAESRAGLRARLKESEAVRVRLMSSLVAAHEAERRRIAADVHDDSIQVMAAACMRVSLVRRQQLPPKTALQLKQLERDIEGAVKRLRHLLFQLQPPSLEEDGLVAALTEYLETWAADAQLRGVLENRLTAEPPGDVRTTLFRIAYEALSNVRKHAQANVATITVASRPPGIGMQIVDDGVGFIDPEAPGSDVGHLGLASIRERAELAGGWCHVTSSPTGTTVEVWIPVEETRP